MAFLKKQPALIAAFLALFSLNAWSVDQAIGPFSGLNDFDNAATIPADKAQDLLNVDLSLGGRSVLKREGYGLAYALAITTSPVHGTYNFFDASGNDVALSFNDTRMTASINGGSATVLFSTGPNGATYQCTDSQGFAYCVNTTRNNVIKTNGQTYSFLTVTATGTMITVTPDRLVQSGIAATPNRVDVSAAADFTSWTTGVGATSAYQFTISAPGSRVTHITYAFNRIMWFKDASFGFILPGQTAADWVVQTISPNVGTLDNTSVYYQGILYFRGQDSHIWSYDGSNLVKLTRDIGATIAASQSRASNSWTQTTQTDWEAGSYSPSGWQDTTGVPGVLKNTATSYSLTSASDWINGGFVTSGTTFYVDTNTVSGNLQTTFPDTFASYRDGSSSSKAVWKTFGTGSPSVTVSGGTLTITNGSGVAGGIRTVQPIPSLSAGVTVYLRAEEWSDGFGICLDTEPVNGFTHCSTLSTKYLEVFFGNSGTYLGTSYLVSSSPNDATVDQCLSACNVGKIAPQDIWFYLDATKYQVKIGSGVISQGSHSLGNFSPYVYLWQNASRYSKTRNFTVVPQTFTWTSGNFNVGVASPSYDAPVISTSNPTNSLSFTGQVGTDGITFDSAVALASGTVPSIGKKQYFKLNVSANQISTNSVSSLSDFYIGAYSSGTFYSAVKNAPSLTAWDSLGVTKQDNGGSHIFYIRSSTNSFTITSTTPSWTAVSAGAVPTVATGTYFQIRDDFVSTSSTQNPTLSDFTQNWFEGSASDKAYATYFKDAIWWSVASGAGATSNNTILRFDLPNTTWLKYDIPINGFYTRQNRLYFGSASTGNIFKFGETDSDNGSAIEAYWKSKDFFMSSPFTDDDVTNLSTFFKAVDNSSMTVTYTVNGGSSTSYTVPLQRTNVSFGRNNRNLPLGTSGNTFSVKFGNDAADQPFEVFAIQYGVTPKSWKPESQ